MSNPMIRIHNVETDEIIDREMTNDELAQYEAEKAKFMKDKSNVEAKAEAKAIAETKLAALGLTAEDLKALGL